MHVEILSKILIIELSLDTYSEIMYYMLFRCTSFKEFILLFLLYSSEPLSKVWITSFETTGFFPYLDIKSPTDFLLFMFEYVILNQIFHTVAAYIFLGCHSCVISWHHSTILAPADICVIRNILFESFVKNNSTLLHTFLN